MDMRDRIICHTPELLDRMKEEDAQRKKQKTCIKPHKNEKKRKKVDKSVIMNVVFGIL